MGTEEIATEVGCTKQAVFKALRAHGIESRSHSQAWWASAKKEHTKTTATPINEGFFSRWSPAAAYVFGVLLTDGNLQLGGESPDGSVRFGSGCVSISQKEPELLDKVGKLIGHSGQTTSIHAASTEAESLVNCISFHSVLIELWRIWYVLAYAHRRVLHSNSRTYQ